MKTRERVTAGGSRMAAALSLPGVEKTTNAGGGFIGYEYKDVAAPRELEGLFVDCFEAFGWRLDANTFVTPGRGPGISTLVFRRDRGVRNRAALARLEREFEIVIREIARLKRSGSTAAAVTAIAAGVAGTACVAGAVFAYLAGMTPLAAVLAVPGFAAWILSPLCHKKIAAARTAVVLPLIDRHYERLYALCRDARKIIAEERDT